MNKLALFGGKPVRDILFPHWPVIGKKEKRAINKVLENGSISSFGTMGPKFYGGKYIQKFEKEFAEYHDIEHAIAVNSATSGLHCAVAAAKAGPGDEVIVPPYTFTATASSVLMNNAIPVFADINPDTFCIDPIEVQKKITSRTKAIIPVHLLGHPCDMLAIMEIARRNNLIVIEDVAQSPGARTNGQLCGTIGDMGVFSFQETKNMMTGEGGMVITNNDDNALSCQMTRNHGEIVTMDRDRDYLSRIIGWNYRITELQASLGLVQLKNLENENEFRRERARYLSEKLGQFDGIICPKELGDIYHVYHVWGGKIDKNELGISRDKFVKAMVAEGIPMRKGYPRPLYMNPLFQNYTKSDKSGFISTHGYYDDSTTLNYKKGCCPVAERMCYEEALWFFHIWSPVQKTDLDDVIFAVEKVLDNKKELLDK